MNSKTVAQIMLHKEDLENMLNEIKSKISSEYFMINITHNGKEFELGNFSYTKIRKGD